VAEYTEDCCFNESNHHLYTRCGTCGTRFTRVDPTSTLGKVMLRARESWGENGPPDPNDFDEDSIRPTPVTD
jgi:hypothetical protein